MANDTSDRFWDKVAVRSPDECWEWMARCNARGYGTFKVGRQSVLAHRRESGETFRSIAADYPVCENSVMWAAAGRTWAHVQEGLDK